MLLAALVGAYLWLTRPAVLRARVQDALNAAGWQVVRLGPVRLRPWGSLTIDQLELRPADDARLTGLPVTLQRLACRRLTLRAGLSGLLRGRIEPRAVRIRGATVRLVRPISLRPGEPSVSTHPARRWPPGLLPALSLEDVDIAVVDSGSAAIVRRRWIVRGRGRPEQGRYVLRLWQQRGAAATPVSALGEPGLLLVVRVSGEGIEAASDWIDGAMLRAVLPPDAVRNLDTLALEGLVRVARLHVAQGRLRTLAVELDRVACELPIEPDAPPGRRFARLKELAGHLRLSWSANRGQSAPDRLTAELRGRLNDATLRVRLSGSGLGVPPTAPHVRLGPLVLRAYRLELTLTGLTVPDVQQHRDFVTSPRLPRPLRASRASSAALGGCPPRGGMPTWRRLRRRETTAG